MRGAERQLAAFCEDSTHLERSSAIDRDEFPPSRLQRAQLVVAIRPRTAVNQPSVGAPSLSA
jgi:hypothetical protein